MVMEIDLSAIQPAPVPATDVPGLVHAADVPESLHAAPAKATLISWLPVIALAVLGLIYVSGWLAYRDLRGRMAVHVVDVDRLTSAKEADFERLASGTSLSDDQKKKLTQDVMAFGPAVMTAIDSEAQACRCTVLNKRAVLASFDASVDVTAAIAGRVGVVLK